MTTLKSAGWRTSRLAERAGCSTQLVRNLERDGVLPPVPRTAAGYRQYGRRHLDALLAYRALAAAVGPAEARGLLRRLDPARPEPTLAALDRAHGRLHRQRVELAEARSAARQLVLEPVDDDRRQDWMGVSELARALGVRASALRHWEAEGLVVPDRWSSRQIRTYSPAQVRDARLVAQLRLAGHRIDALRTLMPTLRAGGRRQHLDEALGRHQADVTARSRALVEASHHLHLLLAEPAGSTG